MDNGHSPCAYSIMHIKLSNCGFGFSEMKSTLNVHQTHSLVKMASWWHVLTPIFSSQNTRINHASECAYSEWQLDEKAAEKTKLTQTTVPFYLSHTKSNSNCIRPICSKTCIPFWITQALVNRRLTIQFLHKPRKNHHSFIAKLF